MIISVFDTHGYDRVALEEENVSFQHELRFFAGRLEEQTAGL